MATVLKAYTENGIISSVPIRSESHIFQMIFEVLLMCNNVKAIYMTDGRQSKQVYSSKAKEERPIYYTRPDGMKVFTLSINSKHYPMTAYYKNGTTKIVNL